MITKDDIEEIIKRDKVPMNGIAELVESLVEDEVGDILSEREEELPTNQMITYAIEQLEECLTEVDIYSKLFELRMLQCKTMKV